MIHLYILTHQITKLKYFGVFHESKNRTFENFLKYSGSGKYWKNHLNKHGYYFTKKFKSFETQEKATKFALRFSRLFDIVSSEKWANLQIEDANTGALGRITTEETKIKIRNALLGKKRNREISEQERENRRKASTGRKHSEETKLKIGNGNKGKIYTNETKRKCGLKNVGKKLTEEHKKKISKGGKGLRKSEETKIKMSISALGKPKSEETKLKISLSKKSKEKITCPYCNKVGDISNMKRYHFNKCKVLIVSV